MDCRTGEIIDLNDTEVQTFKKAAKCSLAPIDEKDVSKVRQMSKPRRKNWMRNQPCPCGSGNKFKKCCWIKYESPPFPTPIEDI